MAKTPPSSKILLALQYYPGDRDDAMSTARMLADVQGGHSDLADLCFVSRHDTTADPQTVVYTSRAFNVMTIRSRRSGTGWPHGPNELWFDLIDQTHERISCGHWPAYKAVLTFEGDTTVLSRDWIRGLVDEWDRRPSGSNMVGSLQAAPAEHINGNMLVSADLGYLAKIRSIGGCSPNAGWDYACRDQFRAWGWAPTEKIVSWWKSKTLLEPDYLELQRRGCLFFHGVKDRTGEAWARKHLIGQRRFGSVIKFPPSPPPIVA